MRASSHRVRTQLLLLLAFACGQTSRPVGRYHEISNDCRSGGCGGMADAGAAGAVFAGSGGSSFGEAGAPPDAGRPDDGGSGGGDAGAGPLRICLDSTDCDPGAPCVRGQCGAPPRQLNVSANCGSIRLVAAGGFVYWTEKASGKIRRVPAAGGEAPTELATGQNNPTQIAADPTALYWVNEGDGRGGSSTLMKMSSLETLVLTKSQDATPILAVAAHAGRVYYALGHDVHSLSPLDGSDDIIVGTATNYDVNFPVGVPSGEPAALAVTDTFVFWTTIGRQGVEREDVLEGQLPNGTDTAGYRELGESQGSLVLRDIGAKGPFAYWANGANVFRAAVAPPEPIAQLRDFSSVVSLAISDSQIYLATDTGEILRHSLEPDVATPPALLAVEQNGLLSVAVDETSVYWSTDDCILRSTPL
jgi:hypothetical protein